MNNEIEQSFLQELIDKLWTKYPDNFSQLCIITPNRRAQVFIKNYLKEKGQALMIPKLFSIEDFIHHLSPYTIFDNVDLSFEFYQVYKHVDAHKKVSDLLGLIQIHWCDSQLSGQQIPSTRTLASPMLLYNLLIQGPEPEPEVFPLKFNNC